MSKIIRSAAAKQEENKKVKIEIRDIFTQQFDVEDEESEQISLKEAKERMLKERSTLLEEAKIQIEQEKQQFEAYRHEELEKIENLKQMWEEEKLVLSQQAYEEGFQQGYEEGIAKAKADMELSLKLANQTIENAKIEAQNYLEQQEKVILDIALKSAERIIGKALEENNELFLSIVKRGLKEAREMKEIKLYISPAYHKLVIENRDELAELFPTDVPFLIFVNDDLESEECYIETNHGRIVVSIDEQLQELRIKLSEILNSKE